MGVRMSTQRKTGDIAVNSRLFHPVPAIAPILLTILTQCVKEQFRLDGKSLCTFQVIGQELTLLFANHS